MQLLTVISAATAMVVGVSARSAVELDASCDKSQAYAKVVNRCDYPVYLWSVYKGSGCPSEAMVTLKNGESYYENLADPDDGVGISIKISKETTCKPTDIVQLEYYMERNSGTYNGDYLDVSYVDCTGDDCPTKSEGYYLVAGNQTGESKASASNTWCPILSCTDAASCALMSYILPDDVQTKTCGLNDNIEFHMCGGDAPDSDSDDGSSYESATPSTSTALASYAASSSVVKSSTTFKAVVSSASKSSSTKTVAPSSTSTYGDSDDEEAKYEVKAAAVTSVPAASSQTTGNSHNVKTEVVYVTAYEYTRVKRHSHDHARRHQQFHA